MGQASPGAAVLVGGVLKTVVCPLPGSSAAGIVSYNGVTTTESGVTIAAVPHGYVAGKPDALTTALDANQFQLMTSAQINNTVSNVIYDGVVANAYSDAVSIFEALGGGPLIPGIGATNPTWIDRNRFVARRGHRTPVQHRCGRAGATTRRRRVKVLVTRIKGGAVRRVSSNR